MSNDKEFDELIKKGKNMDKMDFLRLVFLSGCDVGKRHRNTEVKQATTESIEDSEEYKKVLEHRRECPYWKEMKPCINCWGGGLRNFGELIKIELLQKLGLEE